MRYLPLGVVLVFLGVFFASGLHKALSFEALVRHHVMIQGFVASHAFATAGIYLLTYAALVALSVPISALLTMTGGFLFGWILGGALAVFGSTLGAAGIFLAARTSLAAPLQRKAGPRLQKWAASFRADSFSYLLVLRLLPVLPFWITNLTAALLGMRFKPYLMATLIGVIPLCYAFAVAGSGLEAAIAAHEQDLVDCLAAGNLVCSMDFRPESLLTPQLQVALGLLCLLAFGSLLAKKWLAPVRETDGRR